jgi:hypothetical protein
MRFAKLSAVILIGSIVLVTGCGDSRRAEPGVVVVADGGQACTSERWRGDLPYSMISIHRTPIARRRVSLAPASSAGEIASGSWKVSVFSV